VHYVIGGSPTTLIALVNLGCIAVHVMNCRRRALKQPDWLAFDLDPVSGAFADAARAGRLLRAILDGLRIRSYPKTSGGRGLHVLVPLSPGPTQAEVRAFAQGVGRIMATPGLTFGKSASACPRSGSRPAGHPGHWVRFHPLE